MDKTFMAGMQKQMTTQNGRKSRTLIKSRKNENSLSLHVCCRLCLSYPVEHIVPKQVSDDDLKKVAGFRALARFPTVVWR